MIRSLFNWLAIGLITFPSLFLLPTPIPNVPLASNHGLPIAVLPGLQGVFTGKAPTNLGIQDQQLASCPDSPNCVVSRPSDPEHTIEPIPYQGDRDTTRQTLLKVLTVVPRTTVISQTEDYIRVEFTSRLLGFVDDGEFYFSPDRSEIQIRSASRLGEADLGVNRRRLEQIRLALADLGV
jgi:uncharacterized protein (DUF1499 family)